MPAAETPIETSCVKGRAEGGRRAGDCDELTSCYGSRPAARRPAAATGAGCHPIARSRSYTASYTASYTGNHTGSSTI